MKRGFLLLMPMAIAAIAFAQGTEDTAALVKQLGSDDCALREEAQRKLIEMGEKAVPALEEALKSEDLEVRLRAGRALRAIGGAVKRAEEGEKPEAPSVQQRSTSFTVMPGKVTITVTQTVDGKQETKTYEGASLEELKEKYPELKSQLDGRFQFHVGSRDDFDMDKFWGDRNKNSDSFDEDVRKWQEETRREMESMRRWFDLLRAQPRRMRPQAGLPLQGAMLGAHASTPTTVLDAQLDLRGRGVVIEAVDKGALGDRLGLRRHDILVELNGREIRGTEDVMAALRGLPDGAKVSAKVVRRAQQVTLTGEGTAAPK